MAGGYMYILECADGSYYVGSTRNLEKRVWEHEHGVVPGYTSRRRPVRLVYYEAFESVAEAYGREKEVHGWSRAKRRALIEGRPDDVRRNLRDEQTGRRRRSWR